MNTENLLRIDDLDAPIYRIFPLQRVQELFQKRKLVLVNPGKWEDPFENFLLSRDGVDVDGSTVSFRRLADSWFGQCWTTNSDTDAMWRIYSHDMQSLRVKTTVGKLAKYLWDPDDKFSSLKYFIGKVRYFPREEIEEFLGSASFSELALGGQNQGFAETLLAKRLEFEHESEVRVLTCEIDSDKASQLSGLYKVAVDPHDLVDEICIDPRLLDPFDVECLEKKVRRFGYQGELTQSDLYSVDLPTVPLSPTP
ncbi:MAG: hypothetical protein P1U86_09330 [Verrucomicrobiales bacterium]|nr:hypothetical protein [Verrucomicrobiales bacterium]